MKFLALPIFSNTSFGSANTSGVSAQFDISEITNLWLQMSASGTSTATDLSIQLQVSNDPMSKAASNSLWINQDSAATFSQTSGFDKHTEVTAGKARVSISRNAGAATFSMKATGKGTLHASRTQMFLPAIGPFADLARLNSNLLSDLTIDGVIYSATSTRTSPIQANHLNIKNGGFLLGGNYQLWIRAGIIDVQGGCALASTNTGAGGGELNGVNGEPTSCAGGGCKGGSGLGGGGGGGISGSCITEGGGAGSSTGYGDGAGGDTDGADVASEGGIGLHVNPWAGAPVTGYSIPIGGANGNGTHTVGPGIGQPGDGASVQGACGVQYGGGGGAGNCCSVVQAVWIRTYGVNQIAGSAGSSTSFINGATGAGDGGHLVIAQRFDGFPGAIGCNGGNGEGGSGQGGEIRLYAVNKAGTILTYMGSDPSVSWNNM